MPLRLILGNSGSGKSYKSCREMVEKSMESPATTFFAIVPEQFTLQTQKDIVMMHPAHGVMNIDIVSFARLAFRISQELGVETLETLDDTGKSLILRKIIEDNKSSLRVFRDKIKMPGFVEEMKSMIAELYQYGIDEDGIEEIISIAKSKPLLGAKLRDTATLYKKFRTYLEKKYVTSEEILEKLCKLIPDSKLIKNSEIYLDGFTGFTPVQYRLIGVLLKHAKNLTVCVTTDTRNLKLNVIKEHELFYLSKTTISKLCRVAEENNVEISDHVILSEEIPYRFKKSKTLGHLEKSIYREGKIIKLEDFEGISLNLSKNPNSEIEFVARTISKLVRQDGYRYRDIAVVTGNIEGNYRKIQSVFKINNIPNFIDYKKNIVSNPLIDGISSVLEIIEKDYSYESVFRYLRSGMGNVAREDVDKLENFVLSRGIRGRKAWAGNWDEELDTIKENMVFILNNMYVVFKNKENLLKDYTTALYEFIIESKMPEKLNEYVKMFESSDEPRLAEEYSKVYKMTMELLDQIVLLLGDEKVTRSEYKSILESGFAEIKVGIIPPSIDNVVVGDIERTRLNDIKVLFILNVNEGIIPDVSSGSGVISDKEREFLKTNKIELSPTKREKLFIQKFYLYLNLTKPSEKLYISFSKTTPEGKSLRPSYLVALIKNMYEGLEVVEEDEDLNIDYITTYDTAINYLADGILKYQNGKMDDGAREILSILLSDEKYKDEVLGLIKGAFPETEKSLLDSAVAKVLYGEELRGSVSRLEKYAKCAYSHFLTYGLNLVERKEYKIEAVDLGNLYHSTLEMFNKEIEKEGYSLKNVPEEASKRIVKDCVESVTKDYGNTVFQSSARNNYIINRLERITNKTIWALTEHQKQEKFEPKYFEKDFNFDLKGRIDRIDTYEDGDDLYVKVIDYKSGNNVYNIVDTFYNIQMQLVVYMDEAIKMLGKENPEKNVLPGGLFYYNIKDPYFGRNENKLNEFKMTGLVNSSPEITKAIDSDIYKKSKNYPPLSTEEFYSLINHVKNSITSINQEIVQGKIDVNPCEIGGKYPCEYCSYISVCDFDTKLYDYPETKHLSIDAAEAIERMKGED